MDLTNEIARAERLIAESENPPFKRLMQRTLERLQRQHKPQRKPLLQELREMIARGLQRQ